MKEIKFKLPRYEGIGTTDVAFVTVSSPSIETPLEAMKAICEAVAKWIETTEDGKEMWDNTGEDMNIADISGLQGEDQHFDAALLEFGIHTLSIEIDNLFEDVPRKFHFDSILPNHATNFKNPL